MAEALVGKALLSSLFKFLIGKMASPEFVDFLKGRKISTTLTNKLKITMITVSRVIDVAEELQITNPAVKDWLDELKIALFEADDLLDDIAYESLQAKVNPRRHKVLKPFASRNPFKKKMNEKLEEIIGELQHLIDQKDALGLKEGTVGEKPSSQKIPTTSLVDESGIYGREKDKAAMTDLLVSDNPNGSAVGVIAIVGMAGVGKTTLAQLLYNDSNVREKFDLLAWVCVFEKFDVQKVSQDILLEFTRKKCEITTLNQVQCDLQEKLRGKKFLLVLDDIWDDIHTKWETLKQPLMSGSPGSKIIVTTRHEEATSVMRTAPPHYLKELNPEDCWSLFSKNAFDAGNSAKRPDLEKFGKEIVKKCKGLPLAAKMLGLLLRCKEDAREWQNILDSKFWDLQSDHILPVLRLSYHYLPSHLKQCFAYCAIFPKGCLIEKKNLISLWAGEGFLHPQGNKEMEVIGDQYFEDLMSRSFFQQANYYNSHFVMHDLMHDLAEFVSGDFCFRLEGEDSCKIPEKTRHLSHIGTVLHDDLPKGFFKGQLLRTFLLLEKYQTPDSEVIKDLLSSLERVRVLSLPGTRIDKLPDSIGSLKHLRHLNLSRAPIQRLPESVGVLYNLEMLILNQCKNLVELPSNMGQLINLWRLDIRGTKLQKMPPRMGNLMQLRELAYFIIGEQIGLGINELGKLQHIRDELRIQNLQNVVNARDALEANMMAKKYLKKLEFKWDGEIGNSEHVRDVFENLRPHANLERLYIIGYGGTLFPCWAGDTSLKNLVSLMLNECKNCLRLPPLGQLPSLEGLSITAFDELMSIGPEFYGPMWRPFSSLKILKFERMPKCQEWKDQDRAFPLLEELHIRECPKLKTLPRHLPSLRILKIEGGGPLVPAPPRAPSLSRMIFTHDIFRMVFREYCGGWYMVVEQMSSMESLREMIEQLNAFSICLNEMQIEHCSSLTCCPLEYFPKIWRLYISNCEKLKSLNTAPHRATNDLSSNCSNNPLIEYLCIEDCPQLQVEALLPWATTISSIVFSNKNDIMVLRKLPSGLHHFKICGFQSTRETEMEYLYGASDTFEEVIIRDNDLLMHDFLNHFSVGLFPNLKSLELTNISGAMEIKILPSGLRRFKICGFQSTIETEMEYLYNAFSTFEEVIIRDNDLLKHLPLELFRNLKSLDISGFPSLESSSKANPWDLTSISEEAMPAPNSTPSSSSSPLPRTLTIAEIKLSVRHYDVMLKRLPSELYRLEVNESRPVTGNKLAQLIGAFFGSLEEIEVRNCDLLDFFPLDLFPNLKKFQIEGCPNFESFTATGATLGELKSLTDFEIKRAPKLKSFPRGLHAPNVTFLQLYSCSNLKLLPQCMRSILPSLLKLRVIFCPELEYFPEDGLPSKLQVLNVQSCKKLKFIAVGIQLSSYNEAVESFTKEMMLPSTLTHLTIQEVQNLISLDYKGLKHVTSLKELVIRECPKLQSVPHSMQTLFPSLLGLRINRCPELESFLEGGLPLTLESFEISGCNKLLADLMELDMQMLSGLSNFTFGEFGDVESFPKDILLPFTLASFQIYNLVNLKSLEGIQRFISLTKLVIQGCPKLQSLPEERLPTSLSSLLISRCPVLDETCKPEEGKDWSKISHIANISLLTCRRLIYRKNENGVTTEMRQ